MDAGPTYDGWSGKILWVELAQQKTTVQYIHPYAHAFIGGRGINTKLIFDTAGPTLSPFDPENLLCIGTGPLVGTLAPSSARATISALSPRGLLDYSSIGGFIGAEIKFAGYDHIVIQGRAEQPLYLYITNDAIQFKDARTLWGQDPWQTQQLIREEIQDRDIQSLAIGVAGENQVHFACIMTGRLTSAAGRCGLGAIMGSKNLKAVAVRGRGGVSLAAPDKFLNASRDLRKHISAQSFFQNRRGCDTDKSIFKRHIEDGGKFVAGNWEAADWEEDGFLRLLEDPDLFWQQKAGHLQKGGPQQPGCFGCPMYHETFFDIPEVNDIGRTKCVEWLSFSGSVWITDRRQVNHAAYVCDKYGLDVVSAGNCISFLMELYNKGIISAKDTDGIAMQRGNISAVTQALEKIARQEGFGSLFREGVGAAARKLGPEAEACAMQIKDLELFPEEVRAYKSLALLASVGKSEQYLTLDYSWGSAPADMEQLAEDLYGDRQVAIPNRYDGKARLIWEAEQIHAVTDLLGVCKLLIPWGHSLSLKWPARLLTLATGIDFNEGRLIEAAQRVLLLERAFNAMRGIRRKDEKPPQRFFEDPVPDGRFKGEILHEDQFESMLDEYYHLRGCDAEGRPTKATFLKLDLEEEWDHFSQSMQKA